VHVIQYSGGIGSWATARRVTARYGTQNVVLLFANTLVEESSLYSFLEESTAQLGVPLVCVTGVQAGSSAPRRVT
jgi:hypothetical protein